jgi:hypothetical protein
MSEAQQAEHLLGLSISDGPDLLSYGFGREHLRELLVRVVRPIIVQLGHKLNLPIQLAYGGHIGEGSFALDLIDLISTEKAHGSTDGENGWKGKLYNPSPWPYYQQITPAYEADWINVCKFVRITQEMADLKGKEIIEFPPPGVLTPRIAYNQSRVLTATRQMMSTGLKNDDGKNWLMPPLTWRVALGGRVTGFAGIMPGIFEEVRYALDPPAGAAPVRVYILGGFGGAAHELAEALLGKGGGRDGLPESFEVAYHQQHSQPDYPLMQEGYNTFGNAGEPERELEHISSLVKGARGNLAGTFKNGLNEQENETLLESSDISDVARLVFNGLYSY